MVTDSQLASAIRTIGATGEPFSSAALRAHLGIATGDRRTLTHFNAVLRTYCRENGDTVEQVGKNRYRLLESDERPRLRQIVIRITRTPVEEEPEPQGNWLWASLARLARWLGFGGARERALQADLPD